MSIWKSFGYAWVTLIFFLLSLVVHPIFGWEAFCNNAIEHGQAAQGNDVIIGWGREFENWQSEFLQLLWQVGGLTFLLFAGSQSKEEDDRLEESSARSYARSIGNMPSG